MKKNIIEFVKLGKIPNDNDMTNELFNQYDLLLQNEEPLTYDEAEAIISMFSEAPASSTVVFEVVKMESISSSSHVKSMRAKPAKQPLSMILGRLRRRFLQ